jgi:hypothetical protein
MNEMTVQEMTESDCSEYVKAKNESGNDIFCECDEVEVNHGVIKVGIRLISVAL